MDYQYGLRPASNKMAMARGAKYMKVHNLPGWYNTNSNLFGETRVRQTLTQEEKNARRRAAKPKTPVLPARPKSPNTVFNFPNVNTSGNKWTTPRQSGVKMYNKKALMNKFTGGIGPNSKGMGWAKVKSKFVPLVGTRAKGGGYVVNMLGLNEPRKYDNVVKGLHPFKL